MGKVFVIHPTERFRAILEKECARSNRNEHSFSLVIFDVDRPRADSAEVCQLARLLTNRVRLTDEVGWFDKQRIAVLLPYTSAEGAWKLAEDICQAFSVDVLRTGCKVYTYPSNWFADRNHNGHSAQLHLQGESPERNTTRSQGLASPAKHAEGENTKFTVRPPTSAVPSCQAAKQALEPVLGRSFPVWKRAMDVVGALLGLIVLSPLMLLTAVFIKIVSPGPVFFKQQRMGYIGKTFTMWKFRTMKVNADTSSHQHYLTKLIVDAAHNSEKSAQPMRKVVDDSQIIPFGKLLRRTFIDELPQLINVLRGEMSLVGPRPPIPYEVEKYLCWHEQRLEAVPGMTGLWQVSGKNHLTFNEMVRLDIQYCRGRSFWLDVKILLMTPLVIVSQIKDSLHNE